MKNQGLQKLKVIFLEILELLFLYGLSVNLSAFMNGLSGGYVLLFTGMTISGALLLHVICKRLFRIESNIEKNVSLLPLACLFVNWKLCLMQLMVVNFLWWVRNNKFKDVLMPVIQGVVLLCVNYAYIKKAVTGTQYMFLTFSEISYFEKYLKKKEVCHFKVSAFRKKELLLSILLEAIEQSCLSVLLLISVSSFIDITKVGALFRFEETAIWILGVCIVQILTGLCLKKIQGNESELILSQRFAYIICALVAAIVLTRTSVLLGIIFALLCVAFVAFESLMCMMQKLCNVWVLHAVLLSVFVVSTQLLYDGIYIDIRTFLFVVFLMESFCVRYLSFSDCYLERIEE